MTDVEGVHNLVERAWFSSLVGCITALSFGYLININAMMTLFVLLPLGFLPLLHLKAFGYIRPIFRERGKINAEVTGRLNRNPERDSRHKGFNAEEQEQKTLKQELSAFF